jgi:hypothetical protein
MPGVSSLVKLALIAASAVEAVPKFSNAKPRSVEIRAPRPFPQAAAPSASVPSGAVPSMTPGGAAPPAAGGLTDTDILQLYVCYGKLH